MRFCQRYQRADLFAQCGTDNPRKMLRTRDGCKAVSRWFLKNKILDYMTAGFEAIEEDRGEYGTAPYLE
jgi:hypothetical protein